MFWARTHRWRVVPLALAAALLCAAPALAQAPEVGVRLGVSADGTRVVIDSEGALSATPGTPQDHRLVFTLAGLFVAQPLHGGGQGVVKEWWLGSGEDGAHLTLDLAGDAVVAHRFSIPPGSDGGRFRYVIDLASPLAFPPAVAPVHLANARHATLHRPPEGPVIDANSGSWDPGVQSASVEPRDAAPVRRSRLRTAAIHHARQVVVIDAGHGGHDPGAQSADASEKDITLAAALALRERLERSGRYRVVMTRTSDIFVPLEERVRIARRAGADLFIALHADSAGADARAHGASVYTLSDHGERRVSEVLNGHEWFGRAAARNDPAVNGILLDLTQRDTLNRSSVFAQLLIDRLSDKIDLLPNTHRDAGYFVLLAPDVPAVLLEMGFITCPGDESRLTDPVQRRRLVDAVADAIDAYFTDEVRVAAN